MTFEECVKSGQHLQFVDSDGYCNLCGNQESLEPAGVPTCGIIGAIPTYPLKNRAQEFKHAVDNALAVTEQSARISRQIQMLRDLVLTLYTEIGDMDGEIESLNKALDNSNEFGNKLAKLLTEYGWNRGPTG